MTNPQLLIDKQLVIDARKWANSGCHPDNMDQAQDLIDRLDAALAQPAEMGYPRFWLAVQCDTNDDDGRIAFGLATETNDPNAGECERDLVNQFINKELMRDEPKRHRLVAAYSRPPQQQARVTDEIVDLAESIFLKAWSNADNRRKAMRAAIEAIVDQLMGGVR